MAARYFIPTSGEYAWTGSVWAATATGAAGSAVTPVDGDDVYILNGTARITSALDQSAIQLNSLTIGFSGEIGTSAASLQIGLDASDVAHVNGSGTIRLTLVQTSNSVLNIYDDFMGIIFLNSCTLSSVILGRRGQCVITGGTYSTIVSGGAACTINTTASTSTFVSRGSGNHRVSGPIAGIEIFGSATVTASGADAANNADISIHANGTYVHDSAGTITQIEISPQGRAITTGAYGGFTVTDRYLWAGSQCFDNPSVLITYSNAAIKYGFR